MNFPRLSRRSPGDRPRRPVRGATAVAALAGALLLTACGGGGSDDRSDDNASASPSPSATASADTGGGTGGGEASGKPADGMEGSWLATTGGKAVVLVITGTDAGVFTTGGSVCNGTAENASGTRTIRLKCNDGNTDRASGTVDSLSGKTLKVTWTGKAGTETFTRAEGGELPTGLPTAGIGG
ncbi:hypothetical protein [Streptomyces sp. NPDC057386]|uniref:hypothetical protein n=1 Tax=unclassified Streptomyces TaxID=2593676 RepID=UPI0036302A59